MLTLKLSAAEMSLQHATGVSRITEIALEDG